MQLRGEEATIDSQGNVTAKLNRVCLIFSLCLNGGGHERRDVDEGKGDMLTKRGYRIVTYQLATRSRLLER